MSSYEISKSSLLSLKAEILRKQQELIKAKADNDQKIKIIKKNTPLEIKNKGVESRQIRDLEEVDIDLLKQSRSVLETKSKLYEKLSSGKLSKEDRELQSRFLVRFDKKNRSTTSDLPPSDSDDEPDRYVESDNESYNSDDDATRDPGEKWVDYTDCLGRTRKCLQKDLPYIMSKDEELKKTVEAKNKEQSLTETDVKENEPQLIEDDKKSKESELLSGDMRRELLRQQWEEEEETLRQKTDVHYQDILFGEARTHGVGYYGFSKDEEERAKQQEALRKLRLETEEKQKKAQELKALREKQLAARMKAARNRRRARLGLPPEEEKAPDPAPEVEPTEEETKKQEEAKQKEEVEKLLETARKSHLRPWDIGKEGVKEHYEMTQEEWVEKMRGERPDEFAPPSSYRTEFRSTFKDVDVDEALDKTLKFTTKKLSKNKSRVKGVNKDIESEVKRINPYKYPIQNTHFTKQYENKFHKGSATSNKNMDDFKEIPQSAPVQPTSIENLCDFEFDDRLLRDHESCIKDVENRDTDSNKSKGEDRGRGVEIAPPPSFEYYGPGHSKRPRVTGKGTNIEESIDAGLKFLRNQYERKEKSTKHPREMFLS